MEAATSPNQFQSVTLGDYMVSKSADSNELVTLELNLGRLTATLVGIGWVRKRLGIQTSQKNE